MGSASRKFPLTESVRLLFVPVSTALAGPDSKIFLLAVLPVARLAGEEAKCWQPPGLVQGACGCGAAAPALVEL